MPLHQNISVQKIARLTGHNAAVYALTEGPSPHIIYSGSGEGWVVEWDLTQPDMGKLIARIETNIFSLSFLPEKNLMVAGNMNGGVHWISKDQPEATKNILHHKKGVFKIFELGSNVFTLGGSGIITKWDMEGKAKESAQLSSQSLRSVAWNKEAKLLFIGASDHSIFVFDPESMSVVDHLPDAHENSVFALQFSPDNRYLLSGGRDAVLKIWTWNNRLEVIKEIPAHWFTINDIAFHPEGHIFATSSRDKTIKIWDANEFRLLKVIDNQKFEGHQNSINRLLWLSYNNYLLSASDDRTICVWSIESEMP